MANKDTGNVGFADLPGIPPDATKYEILGVSRDASDEELKLAYRRRALLYHPDRHVEEDRGLAEQVFKRITSAYRVLSDARERKRYDLSLQRNEQYRESTRDSESISLAEILAEIDVYEHIFATDAMRELNATLQEIVSRNLISEVGEQVVAVWPMTAAPAGNSHPGTFHAGAVVLTNVRLMLPFTYKWQETKGNVKYTYTGARMPVFALPLVQSFCVVEHGRVRPVIWVEIHHPDGITRFRPGRSNLSKLLLIASLWGIHVDSRREETASRELRWAVLDPWMWGAAATFAILVAAACAALFGGGIVDNPVDLAKFFAQTGVWQFYVIGLATLSAWRIYRYTVQHERRKLNEVLLKREEPEQGITRGAA